MIEIPEAVKPLMETSVGRVRRIYLLRGAAAALATAIGAVMAAMAVDAFFTLFSDAARWGLSAALYAFVLAAAYFTLVRPLSRRIDARRMAKILDGRHPENEECLTTLVELVDAARAKGGRHGFSEELVRILAEKASRAASSIDPEREFTSRTVVRRLKWLVAVAAVLAVSFAAAPHLAGRLFVRAVAPWVDVGNLYAGDITVKPGDVVALSGSVVRIEATVADGLHYSPSIRISRRTALGWGEEFSEEMRDGAYEATADIADREWRYRVCAGPAISRYYTVRVCEMPQYETFTARVDYPEYTGLSPSVVSNEEVSTLSAVEGSRVSFSVVLGPNAERYDLAIGGKPADGWTMVSNKVAKWSLDLFGAYGFAAPRQGGLLRSFVDLPPTVVVEEPSSKALGLPPHAKFPLVVSASDDIGISVSVVRCAVDGGEWREMRAMASCEKSGASLWKGVDEIDLSELDLDGAKTVSFDIVVSDRYPAGMGGPHSATSTPVVVRMESKAASFGTQSVSEEVASARKTLDEAHKRLDDARRLAIQAKDQIHSERKVGEGADRKVERAVHEASEARKRVEELSRNLDDDGRFKPVADKLDSIRERRIDPALENLEVAQFDEPERRKKALEDAAYELQSAAEAISRLGESLKERAKGIENYERTKDLAARQEALARAANDMMRERPVDSGKLEAWKRMQHEAASQAKDLEGKVRDGDMDEARRKMYRAADLMDELKNQIGVAADRKMDEAAREKILGQKEQELARQRDEAMRQAVEAEKQAAEFLKNAQSNGDRNRREEFMRRVAEAQSRAEDLLERAEAKSPSLDAQRGASAERKGAMESERPKESAIARQAEALRAAEAELAERREASRTAAGQQAAEKGSPEGGERPQGENDKGGAAAQPERMQAEQSRLNDAVDGAAEAMATAEQKMAEAIEAIKQGVFNVAAESAKASQEMQRQAQSAMEEMMHSAALPTEAIAPLKDAMKTQREAAKFEGEAVRFAEQASRNAKNGEARHRVRQNQYSADNAQQDAARGLEAVKRAVEGRYSVQQGDSGAQGNGSQGRSNAGEKAAEAAKVLKAEAERQANALGLNERERGGGSKSKGKSSDTDSASGGGVSDEIAWLAKELRRNDDPGAIRKLFERLGWFRIKGAAKDGLGEGDLKDIPAEYRELVRAYFLRLSCLSPIP